MSFTKYVIVLTNKVVEPLIDVPQTPVVVPSHPVLPGDLGVVQPGLGQSLGSSLGVNQDLQKGKERLDLVFTWLIHI